jgi:membrane protein required for colicin V production
MNLLDVFTAVFLVYFMLRGFFRGFAQDLFGLGGLIVAVFVGVLIYHPAGRMVADLTGIPKHLAGIAAFIVLFLIILAVFAFVGRMFSEALKKLRLSAVNRVLGVGFGGVKGVLITGVLLFGIDSMLRHVGRATTMDRTLFARPVMDLAMALIGQLIPGGL